MMSFGRSTTRRSLSSPRTSSPHALASSPDSVLASIYSRLNTPTFTHPAIQLCPLTATYSLPAYSTSSTLLARSSSSSLTFTSFTSSPPPTSASAVAVATPTARSARHSSSLDLASSVPSLSPSVLPIPSTSLIRQLLPHSHQCPSTSLSPTLHSL